MVVEVVGVVVDMCWHVNMVVCGDGSGVKLADLEEKNVKNIIMCSLFTIHTMLSVSESHVTANSSTNHYLHDDNNIGICFFLLSFVLYY